MLKKYSQTDYSFAALKRNQNHHLAYLKSRYLYSGIQTPTTPDQIDAWIISHHLFIYFQCLSPKDNLHPVLQYH